MGDLSKNISRHEIACKCGCDFDTMDIETINVVQGICDDINADKVTLRINSGARCVEHNKAIGSTNTSKHVKARAMDITIDGITPQELYDLLDNKYPDTYGLGLYGSFVHIDTRSLKARW